MLHTNFILADGDELPVKLIFYGFIGLVWVIGAIASKLKKAGNAPVTRQPDAPNRGPASNAPTPAPGAPTPQSMAALLQAMRADTPRMRELGMRPNQPVRRPQPSQTRRPSMVDPRQPAIVQQAQSLQQMMSAQPVRASLPLPRVARPTPPAAPVTPKPPAAVTATSIAGTGLEQPLTARFGHRSGALGDISAMLRPGFLARQFVLSEILRPPVSLRDPDERGV